MMNDYEKNETEAYINELTQKQTKQNRNRKVNLGKYTEWYNKKPRILNFNTYFWNGMQVQGKYRNKLAEQYVQGVGEWLEKVFNDRVKIDLNNKTVYLDNTEVFFINISRTHYYKHQNLPYIKQQVKKLLGGE